MPEELFKAQYDITKKSKVKIFYDRNKILIFSLIFVFIISTASIVFYLESKENKKILMAENYIQAKIFLEMGEKKKAKNLLKLTVLENDATYSTLSFFLIIDQNLVTDYTETSDFLNHLLKNNKISKEIKDLLIYKSALLSSNFVDESNLIKSLKPLLKNDNIWKPHALLLLGDYFLAKKEKIKAIEFYQEIFLIKNLHNDIYSHAKSQLSSISND